MRPISIRGRRVGAEPINLIALLASQTELYVLLAQNEQPIEIDSHVRHRKPAKHHRSVLADVASLAEANSCPKPCLFRLRWPFQ